MEAHPTATVDERKESLRAFAKDNDIHEDLVFLPKAVIRTSFSLALDVFKPEKVSDAQLHGLKLVIGGMSDRHDILSADTLTRLHMCLQAVEEDDIGDWL